MFMERNLATFVRIADQGRNLEDVKHSEGVPGLPVESACLKWSG